MCFGYYLGRMLNNFNNFNNINKIDKNDEKNEKNGGNRGKMGSNKNNKNRNEKKMNELNELDGEFSLLIRDYVSDQQIGNGIGFCVDSVELVLKPNIVDNALITVSVGIARFECKQRIQSYSRKTNYYPNRSVCFLTFPFFFFCFYFCFVCILF